MNVQISYRRSAEQVQTIVNATSPSALHDLLTAALDGAWLTVTVEDDGVGIPDIEKAMEPMYTTKPQLDRSGMGFSFMEAFMDEVQVESEPGLGTTVTMRKTLGNAEE